MAKVPPSSPIPIPSRELFRDEYMVVNVEAEGAIVRLVRSAVAYASIAALNESFEKVIGVMDLLGRRGRVMLFDTRAPQGRNDPEFEQAMATLRPRIDRGFSRIGVVVKSAAGGLQMRRWVSTDGIERLTGSDEAAIVDAILSGLPSRRS